MRPRVFICGSSHALRIKNAILSDQFWVDNYIIKSYARPGASFSELTFPDFSKLSKKDLVIIQCFGNDLFEKYIEVERTPAGKIIHLTKVKPILEEKIAKLYGLLKEKIENSKAHVIVLDNILRHLKCCVDHYSPEVGEFQSRQNAILREYFQAIPNVLSLDHKTLLGISIRHLEDEEVYALLYEDGVHLQKKYYHRIAKELKKQIFELLFKD